MDERRDPRILIYSNLDNVQKDIEQAAKDRKDEIRSQMEQEKKSLKDGVKDLKQEAKDSYKEYKEYKKDSNDPAAGHKISAAKDVSKAIEKGIENDYQDTVDRMERDAEHRMNSIDNMLKDQQED